MSILGHNIFFPFFLLFYFPFSNVYFFPVHVVFCFPHFKHCKYGSALIDNYLTGDSVIVKREQSTESDTGSVHTPERQVSNAVTATEYGFPDIFV